MALILLVLLHMWTVVLVKAQVSLVTFSFSYPFLSCLSVGIFICGTKTRILLHFIVLPVVLWSDFVFMVVVQKRSEELVCASGEQVEAVSNLGNKVILGSKGNNTAANSTSIVYMDEFDTSVATLNSVNSLFSLFSTQVYTLIFFGINVFPSKPLLFRQLFGSIFMNIQRHYRF